MKSHGKLFNFKNLVACIISFCQTFLGLFFHLIIFPVRREQSSSPLSNIYFLSEEEIGNLLFFLFGDEEGKLGNSCLGVESFLLQLFINCQK